MKLPNRTLILILYCYLLCFCSCSANWHIKKAIKKNPEIASLVVDTIQVSKTVIDTIYNSDSTFYIEHRTVNFDTIISYQKYDMSEVKGWFQSWQDNRTERTIIRHASKVQKTQIKQENRTQRKKAKESRKEANNIWKWISLVAIAALIGHFIMLYIDRKKKSK